jgi:hypothetical protein
LLRNNHRIWYAELKVVGAIYVALTLEFEGLYIRFREISEHFEAPHDFNTAACYAISHTTLTDILARDTVKGGIQN